MSSEIIARVIVAMCFGIALSLFITPVYIFIRKIMYGPFLNKKLLKKAIDAGHIVQAKQVKSYSAGDKEHLIYEYEWNGKTYKCRGISNSYTGNPSSFELYFIKNPRKVANCDELYLTAKSPWIVSYLIIALIISIIAFFMLSYMSPDELVNSIQNSIK